MKKSFLLFVFALAHLCPLSALAGDRIGNGGDALACKMPDGSIQYETLDLFQAREDYHLSVYLGDDSMNAVEKVEFVLKRLRTKAPRMEIRYRRWLAQFFNELEFLTERRLLDIPDTGALAIPLHCELKQAAVQRTELEQFDGRPRYSIQKSIWDALDNDNKAALILHELVYRDLLTHSEAQNSMFVRYLTAHLLRSDLPDIDFNKILMNARNGHIEYEGTLYRVRYKVISSYEWDFIISVYPEEAKLPLSYLYPHVPVFRGLKAVEVNRYMGAVSYVRGTTVVRSAEGEEKVISPHKFRILNDKIGFDVEDCTFPTPILWVDYYGEIIGCGDDRWNN